MRLLYALLTLLLAGAGGAVPAAAPAAAQSSAHRSAVADEDDAPLYHVVGRPATVFMQPDSTQPYLEADFREPLYLLEKGPRWSHIRTADGAKGYVRSHAISNVWVRVSKEDKQVYLYEGARRLMAVPADFGYNVYLDKTRRGSSLRRDDWRTPEGTFYVVRKNPNSQFYRAFVLNYPTVEDAERGLEKGLISKAEHRRIVEAQKTLAMPPMGTALGGMIEIHGDGTGAARNWTRGCVAIHNSHIDKMWYRVEVGTPVVIE